MVRIRPANGAKLDRLVVLENEITFGADGWADGSKLTTAELDRLRRFHFLVEDVKESEQVESSAKVNDEPPDSSDEESDSDNAPADDATGNETMEASEEKPKRKRTAKKSE